MKVILKEKGLIAYGLFLSSVIAVIAYLFLLIERTLSEVVWDLVPRESSFRVVYVVSICLIGGVIVGVCRKQWGNVPTTARDTIAELRQEKTVNYTPVFRHLFIALVILIFGAGVGPEAGLLSAIVSLSVWQADKLRYLYFNRHTFKQFPLVDKIKNLVNPLACLQTYDVNKAVGGDKRREKLFLYTLYIINGLITFAILMKITKQPSFVTKMGVSHWQWKEMQWLLPLMIFGILYGYGYRWFTKVCEKVFSFWQEFPLRKALLGSLAIMAIGIYLPNLLSSGQAALKLVPDVSTQASFITLSLLALLKLLFLQICLKTGWIGGDIIPIVFSAILQGFAVTQLLPNVDKLLIVAVISASIVITSFKQPLFGLFVALFFPMNVLPIFLVVILVFYVGQKLQKGLAKRKRNV